MDNCTTTPRLEFRNRPGRAIRAGHRCTVRRIHGCVRWTRLTTLAPHFSFCCSQPCGLKSRAQAPLSGCRAHLHDKPAQPAVPRVRLQPGVPQQGPADLFQRERQRKAVHPFAKDAGVSFGNASDQLRGPGQGQVSCFRPRQIPARDGLQVPADAAAQAPNASAGRRERPWRVPPDRPG